MDKELANWIYYEEGHTYYCSDCINDLIDWLNKVEGIGTIAK